MSPHLVINFQTLKLAKNSLCLLYLFLVLCTYRKNESVLFCLPKVRGRGSFQPIFYLFFINPQPTLKHIFGQKTGKFIFFQQIYFKKWCNMNQLWIFPFMTQLTMLYFVYPCFKFSQSLCGGFVWPGLHKMQDERKAVQEKRRTVLSSGWKSFWDSNP